MKSRRSGESMGLGVDSRAVTGTAGDGRKGSFWRKISSDVVRAVNGLAVCGTRTECGRSPRGRNMSGRRATGFPPFRDIPASDLVRNTENAAPGLSLAEEPAKDPEPGERMGTKGMVKLLFSAVTGTEWWACSEDDLGVSSRGRIGECSSDWADS